MINPYRIFNTSLLLAILLTTSCTEEQASNAAAESLSDSDLITVTKEQFNQSNFEIGRPHKRSITTTLDASGRVVVPSRASASVSTLLPGIVHNWKHLEGQHVRKGEQLFTITNPELIQMQEDYLVLSSEVDYLQAEANRQSKLARQNITTQQQLNKIESDLHSKKARHQALHKKLSLYGIDPAGVTATTLTTSLAVRAPISGVISHVDLMNGMYLDTPTPALQITNTDDILLSLTVFEKDLALIKEGQLVQFTIASEQDENLTAKIHQISPIAKSNGQVAILAKISTEAQKIQPGMYAQARIVVESKELVALPKTAIVRSGEQNYALEVVRSDEKAYMLAQHPVDVIMSDDMYIALEVADTTVQYLTKGAYFLTQ